MADPTEQGPMPGLISRGLGMLFGTKPRNGGMAPPPVKTVLAPTAPTPEMLGSGLAANAGTALQNRGSALQEALKNAGAD